MPLLPIVFSLALAALTALIGTIRGADFIIAEFRWMSLAAGISVAYAFLELLPELHSAQVELALSGFLDVLHNEAYLLAFVSVALFYALEIVAIRSRRTGRGREGREHTSGGVFTVHIVFFALYFFLIGDIVAAVDEKGLAAALLFCIALAFHFFIIDEGLRHHHRVRYDRWGRWVLAAALVLGTVNGMFSFAFSTMTAFLWAFVAGGLILNTLKEELPESKESCLPSFFVGAILFAILLQVL